MSLLNILSKLLYNNLHQILEIPPLKSITIYCTFELFGLGEPRVGLRE